MRAQAPWPGRWQRRLLTIPGQADDTSSLVIWLQTAHLYADLRVKWERFGTSGRHSVRQLLTWIRAQQ